MAISILRAKSAGELDQAFRVRYDVYVEEEERFPPKPDRRIYDRFDAFPGTHIVLAIDRDAPEPLPVGTVRFAAKSEVGLPSDHFYDFSGLTKTLEGGVATLGMLAVRRRYRMTRGLVVTMILVAWRELRKAGVRHLVAPASPDAAPILMAMGGRKVGDDFTYGDPPVLMTPIYLDMLNITPTFREMSIDPRHILLEELHERRLYRQGHHVVRQGEAGEEAFLVMRGSVRVHSGDKGSPRAQYLLGPGEIFGELALLDGGEHPVTVEVHSKLADLGVVRRDDFQAKLGSDAAFGRRVLKILTERIRKLLLDMPPDHLAEVNQEALIAQVLLEVSEEGGKEVEPRWLAAECGLREAELTERIEPWVRSGIVSRGSEGMVIVSDPRSLRTILDHVIDSAALAGGLAGESHER